jgi:hypothetical protein
VSALDILDHERVLAEAWDAPGNTVVDLPPVDINETLQSRYRLSQPLHFTRSMLWDMEVRKAQSPDIFIPTVVRPGSLEYIEGFFRGPRHDFTRVTDQKLWLDQSAYGRVIERVRLDFSRQSAIFIGMPFLTTPDGRSLTTGTGQPIFHVEHGVSGAEDRPINHWRIVLLTEVPDAALIETFDCMGKDPYLRVFLEVYIRDVLGIEMERV